MVVPLKICLYKIPRNCTCYLIWGKALRDIIKLRILSKGNHLGLPRWALNPMTNVLKKDTQKKHKIEVEKAKRQKQRLEWCGYKPRNAKDCRQPHKLGERHRMNSLPEAQWSITTPWFGTLSE